MTIDPVRPVSANGVLLAAARLDGAAILTPLVENQPLNEMLEARILFKVETLQHCGSFKFRGAYNLLSQLAARGCEGVVAWSSGNHAQGVAYAASRLGLRATIVMPADAPAIKRERVLSLGAEIVPYDRYTEDREAIGHEIAERKKWPLAPSYDHADIIEGQGTVALEAVNQAAALNESIDAFVFCCGGGGLASGGATILEEISPSAEIHIVEPEGFDDWGQSLSAGERVSIDASRRTICDAIATPVPGQLTFPILRRRSAIAHAVSEEAVRRAVFWAFERLKIVLEPGGAVALAAILEKSLDTKGRTIVATLSGGNVDPALFAEILRGFAKE